MYFKASKNPKFDPTVQVLQRKLNIIRNRIHGSWPNLVADGLFGEQTKQAVKGFQLYRNITPVSGEVGNTTWQHINELYDYNPVLKNDDNFLLGGDESEWKSATVKAITQLTDYLNGISKDIENQIKRFKQQNINPQDIEQLMRRFFQRPDIDAMRNSIEKDMFKELDRIARKNNGHAWGKGYSIDEFNQKEAQRQVSKKVLNSQSRKVVEKKLTEQLQQRLVNELESANFKNKITNAIRSKGIPKVTGGGIFNAIMFFPIAWHAIVFIDACINNKPNTDRALNTLVSDIISLVEGLLIGLAVGLVVTVIGLVGWVAVVVALVISIIVGVAVEIFFPNHAKTLAEKLISYTKNLLNSSVFQESARTSFI